MTERERAILAAALAWEAAGMERLRSALQPANKGRPSAAVLLRHTEACRALMHAVAAYRLEQRSA